MFSCPPSFKPPFQKDGMASTNLKPYAATVFTPLLFPDKPSHVDEMVFLNAETDGTIFLKKIIYSFLPCTKMPRNRLFLLENQ